MEKNFWPEGVILPELGIFEVFHCKSELQPGVLTDFWLFHRPVNKSFHRFFLMFYQFYFIFPFYIKDLKLEKIKRGSSFAKMRLTLLDKKSKSY